MTVEQDIDVIRVLKILDEGGLGKHGLKHAC